MICSVTDGRANVALHEPPAEPVDADASPIARLPMSERFHWLVAPRSAVLQTSPVHGGVCEDPAAALRELLGARVA